MDGKPKRVREADDNAEEMQQNDEDHPYKRRHIRSQYRQIEGRIHDGTEEIANGDLDKFTEIMDQLDNVYQHVNKPREQIADAGALLGLTGSFVASVKTHTRGGVTPGRFVSRLISDFGKQKGLSRDSPPVILWKSIGLVAAPLFRNVPGCMSMYGPMMDVVKKLRKRPAARRTTRSRAPRAYYSPQELRKPAEVVNDTDNTIRLMFKLLPTKKNIKVENLVLSRSSFAETVENLFALSFLVKDGRVRIDVDANGSQVVAPTNGPRAEQIKSGAVKHHHFVFRFDFSDWKTMKDLVPDGEEVMKARYAHANFNAEGSSKDCNNEVDSIPIGCPIVNPAPVRKFSRNSGHVTVAEY